MVTEDERNYVAGLAVDFGALVVGFARLEVVSVDEVVGAAGPGRVVGGSHVS